MYLTININAFLNIDTQVYIFKPAYLVNIACYHKYILTIEIVSLLLHSVQAESEYMQQFGLLGSLRTVKTISS